ncbi:MAG: ATPase, partial [Lachnospiraceae bacterium]|nr:ATPase [Lachnospiraceae bacterium]
NVLLVSYSMTHHTRQSALGLPYIAEKNYGGHTFQVSEYTMSEIIASVYDVMEETGKQEGILFLDEINCVSETLTPSMLQFLQFKTFGRHTLPDGWLVVTAGNPPEYNRTVREFDIVTLDRLKKIDVEPDFDAWKEYAWKHGVHAAVMSYLEIKKNYFYHVETEVKGKIFVTARGWEDLSRMIRLCEKKNLPVNGKLISQYLQDPKIAADFAAYYDLFLKYRSDYQVESILAGQESQEIRSRASAARFDERIALLGLLIGAISDQCAQIAEQENCLVLALDALKKVRMAASAADLSAASMDASGLPGGMNSCLRDLLKEQADQLGHTVRIRQKGASITQAEKRAYQKAIAFLTSCGQSSHDFDTCKNEYKNEALRLAADAKETGEKLDHVFSFLEKVYPQGQEILLFVTELTIDETTASFISHYGCEPYDRHSKNLLFFERGKELTRRIKDLT